MSGGLPNGARQLAGFAVVLREAGFAVSPEQNVTFLQATTCLGPRAVSDLLLAARASFGPPPERGEEFAALFRSYFFGELAIETATATDPEQPRAFDGSDSTFEAPDLGEFNPSGEKTSTSEVLSRRTFDDDFEEDGLRRFARRAPARLPRRVGYRRQRAQRGDVLDVRRGLRTVVRNHGDLHRLHWRRRKPRQRKVLILIDVSGSMKTYTDIYMRFAHAIAHAARYVECFTFGTRLTRITKALRVKNRELALARAGETVADWDGGTRIGEALQSFMAVPRFAGYARGALVIVLSDGLERGDPAALQDAAAKLAWRAWRIVWLSPLASAADYRPETAALKSIMPLIDDFAAAGTPGELYANTLRLASRRQQMGGRSK